MAERSALRRWLSRNVAHPLEAAAVRTLLALSRLAGPTLASNAGGFLGRTFGPHLGISRRARRNLELAMPGLDAAARERILRETWDNLGRTVAEYPHLPAIAAGRTEFAGDGNVALAKAHGKSVLFFGAHMANWEVCPAVARAKGMPIHVVFRPANNPRVDRLINACRAGTVAGAIPKGAEGARQVMKLMAAGEHFGMLLDQKQNDGIPVPFMGRDAMTTFAPAAFARRYGAMLMPIRVERLGPARFRVTAEPPVEQAIGGKRDDDLRETMARVNAVYERWIRARPGEWLWLHRRWPDS
jgi:KDO2-lipid IV(A) lauroyltransferase